MWSEMLEAPRQQLQVARGAVSGALRAMMRRDYSLVSLRDHEAIGMLLWPR